MTRIVMIAPHFEEYAYCLSRELAKAADILLILKKDVLDSEFQGRVRPDAPGVTIQSNGFQSIVDLVRLFWVIVRFRPTVIHWQEPSGLIKAVMAALLIMLTRPFATTALTIHDPVPHSGRDAVVANRLARARRYTRRIVHRIFVHGPACRAQYLNSYLPAPHRDARVRVTEHGAILVSDQASPSRQPFSALMFGRMEAYKGLDTLCQAAEAMLKDDISVPLDIVGAGPEIDRLEARFHALPDVTVVNAFVPSVDLITHILAAHCVLLPYLSATQSGVLAAAFGNGRFVIASRIGGITDIVEHGVNGLLVEPGDPAALAEALASVMADASLRERLTDGARRTAAERMDWSSIASVMLQDYRVR